MATIFRQQLAATIVSIELVSILYKLSGISGQLTTNFLDTELTFKYKL